MYIYPRRPLMTVLANLVAVATETAALVRGILKVNIVNTSVPASQSGTWTVTVGTWSATGIVNNRGLGKVHSSEDYHHVNHAFAQSYINRKAVT